MEKPTEKEFREVLEKERRQIRELFLSPSGQLFLKHLTRIQNLPRMFDPDPYIMAYRCAIHDVIGSILDLAEHHDG